MPFFEIHIYIIISFFCDTAEIGDILITISGSSSFGLKFKVLKYDS